MTTKKKRGRPAGRSTSEFQAVSFLEPDSLKMWLDKLSSDGDIGRYWYIHHEPDTDDKKPHQHFRMTPPLGRAVDWASIVARIVQHVDGEDLPRKVKWKSDSVNNNGLPGLLYARHDKRFLDIVSPDKPKAVYDYGRLEFVTNDPDWLDDLWRQSDEYEPKPKRMSRTDIADLIDREHGHISYSSLTRLCLRNDLSYSDFLLLDRHRAACLSEPLTPEESTNDTAHN